MHNKVSILVVDDDPDMLWIINQILTLSGYQVTTVLNGFDALACLQTQSFTLAMIDLGDD